jgi:ArsR family transcriptional regulator, lead/cadmium/zinc/bismuth-responsive transcriptional repressor
VIVVAATPAPGEPAPDQSSARDLLPDEEAAELVALFKVLASETRLRLLVALGDGEMRVTELAELVGLSTQAMSNQLQRLVDRQIVAARRDGNSVYYRIIDSCVSDTVKAARCLVDEPR